MSSGGDAAAQSTMDGAAQEKVAATFEAADEGSVASEHPVAGQKSPRIKIAPSTVPPNPSEVIMSELPALTLGAPESSQEAAQLKEVVVCNMAGEMKFSASLDLARVNGRELKQYVIAAADEEDALHATELAYLRLLVGDQVVEDTAALISLAAQTHCGTLAVSLLTVGHLHIDVESNADGSQKYRCEECWVRDIPSGGAVHVAHGFSFSVQPDIDGFLICPQAGHFDGELSCKFLAEGSKDEFCFSMLTESDMLVCGQVSQDPYVQASGVWFRRDGQYGRWATMSGREVRELPEASVPCKASGQFNIWCVNGNNWCGRNSFTLNTTTGGDGIVISGPDVSASVFYGEGPTLAFIADGPQFWLVTQRRMLVRGRFVAEGFVEGTWSRSENDYGRWKCAALTLRRDRLAT